MKGQDEWHRGILTIGWKLKHGTKWGNLLILLTRWPKGFRKSNRILITRSGNEVGNSFDLRDLPGSDSFLQGLLMKLIIPFLPFRWLQNLFCPGSLEKSDEEKDEDSKVSEQYLSMIQREADRCQKFTQRLLHFARGDDGVKREHNLINIVEEVLSIIQPMSKFKDRKILFHHGINPCMMEINGPEIKQVVLNLVANALESMSSGGTLKISIQEQRDLVTLKLIDDGCGMTTEVMERLFDPFFTQRRDGKGTGLGMSISQRIVGEHGGMIEAESEGPGKGSTFFVRIPRIQNQQESAA